MDQLAAMMMVSLIVDGNGDKSDHHDTDDNNADYKYVTNATSSDIESGNSLCLR